MPLIVAHPPKGSLAKLGQALESLSLLNVKQANWMKMHPPTAATLRRSYLHPLYRLRVLDLLRGEPLGRSLDRVAWVYPLQDREKRLGVAEISVSKGVHGSVRVTEGPFARRLKRSIEKVEGDPRLKGRWELRAIRIESVHLLALWIKKQHGESMFIPVNSLRKSLVAGRWFTQQEFIASLLPEAKRIQEAHSRFMQSGVNKKR
jgi:hypothetical protein